MGGLEHPYLTDWSLLVSGGGFKKIPQGADPHLTLCTSRGGRGPQLASLCRKGGSLAV